MNHPKSKPYLSVRQLCAAALGAAVISICSWITIPAAVPFTLQTFAVCLVTGLLGLKCGIFSVIVYLLLGAVGIPVFSGFTGGIGHLLGSTGGYLIGFIFTAIVVGLCVGKWGRKIPVLAAGMVLGIALCYVFGTAWFMLVYTRANGPTALGLVLGWCVTPFLIPDAIKIFLAIILVNRLSGHLPRTE